MNFWKNLHPLLRRDKNNDYGSANYAVLSSLADSLSDAERDAMQKKVQLTLGTATGGYLDEWGSWFSVTRRDGETDDDYRKRIMWYLTVPRSTIEGIITGIRYYLDDSDARISIYEPWKNIFYLNKSKLNGDDHLQGYYYRYAVIDVSIDRPMSKAIYDAIAAFKPAGVKFYTTFNPNINAKVQKLTVAELKARKLFTMEKAYGFMYDHKLPVTFSDRPATLVNNTNYLKLNDSKLNGEDALAGSPTHNVTYWNPLRLSYSPYKNVPVNLFLQSTATAGYVDGSTGNINPESATNNEIVSDYISVSASSNYTFQMWGTTPAGFSLWYGIGLYDSDRKFISRPSGGGKLKTSDTEEYVSKTFTTTSTTAYVRVSFRRYNDYKAKLELGSIATPWSPNPADPEYFASTPTQRAILSSPSNTYVPLPLPSSNSPYKDVPVNLINGSYDSSWSFYSINNATVDKVTMDSGEVALHVIGTSNVSGFYAVFNLPTNVSYTASVEVKGTGKVNTLGWQNWEAPEQMPGMTPTSNWQRVSRTVSSDSKLPSFICYGKMDVYVKLLKVEKGTTATPWSPNPADPEYLGSAPTRMLSGTLSVYNQFITNYSSLLSTYSGNTEYDRVRSLVEDTHTTVSLVVNADVPLTINGVLYPAGLSSVPVDKGSLNYTGSDITIPVSVTGTQDARVYYVYAKVKVSKDTPGLGVNIKANQNVSIIKSGPVVGTAVVGAAVVGQETIISNTK